MEVSCKKVIETRIFRRRTSIYLLICLPTYFSTISLDDGVTSKSFSYCWCHWSILVGCTTGEWCDPPRQTNSSVLNQHPSSTDVVSHFDGAVAYILTRRFSFVSKRPSASGKSRIRPTWHTTPSLPLQPTEQLQMQVSCIIAVLWSVIHQNDRVRPTQPSHPLCYPP